MKYLNMSLIIITVILLCILFQGINNQKAIPEPEIVFTSDFKLIDIQGFWKYKHYHIKGKLINNSKYAGGAEITATAKNKNGEVIKSKDFWPASTYNIYPGDTIPFDHHITKDSSASIMEAYISDALIWRFGKRKWPIYRYRKERSTNKKKD